MIGCTYGTFCGSGARWNHGQVEDTAVSGVFVPLINRAAFVDKLVQGIHGTLRRRLPRTIKKTANLAIGGPGRAYARSMHGVYVPSGNPFEVKYGRNPTYKNSFDAKLTVRSERTPLSFNEITEIVGCLFRKGNRPILNSMEFTSDVSVPFQYFENHLLTRARSIRTLMDDRGRQTLYAGSPGAEWMLRIYQKTKETTRVERVLRRSCLAKVGINDLAALGALRDFPLNRLVRFPTVCQRALEDVIRGKVTGKQSQIILGWPGKRPIGMLLEILRDHGLPGDQILRASAVEEMLWKMQKSFSWSNEGVGTSEG